MKRIVNIALVLACFAGAAFAQTPTETQMRDNADTQRRLAQSNHNVARNQTEYFKSLDRNQKGYLDNDDVSADPFLQKNFINCDSDHDGKLTLAELQICTRNNPPPPQP